MMIMTTIINNNDDDNNNERRTTGRQCFRSCSMKRLPTSLLLFLPLLTLLVLTIVCFAAFYETAAVSAAAASSLAHDRVFGVSVLNQAKGDQGAEVVSLMLPFLSSPLPRIQHASLKALERLAEEQIAGEREILKWTCPTNGTIKCLCCCHPDTSIHRLLLAHT